MAVICEVMAPDGHMLVGSAVERFASALGHPDDLDRRAGDPPLGTRDERNSNAAYDEIGTGYARHRRDDPRLAVPLHAALGDANGSSTSAPVPVPTNPPIDGWWPWSLHR